MVDYPNYCIATSAVDSAVCYERMLGSNLDRCPHLSIVLTGFVRVLSLDKRCRNIWEIALLGLCVEVEMEFQNLRSKLYGRSCVSLIETDVIDADVIIHY